MKVHSRPDPRISRAMLTAEPVSRWGSDGVPNEMISFLWGRVEGANGCALPIEAMHCRGFVLFVHTTETLLPGHEEQIRQLWSGITGRDRPTVMFSIHDEEPEPEPWDHSRPLPF